MNALPKDITYMRTIIAKRLLDLDNEQNDDKSLLIPASKTDPVHSSTEMYPLS